MGIPLVRIPVDGQNVLWASIESHLWPLLDQLPVNWGAFGIYSRRGWLFKDSGDSHRLYGPIWALVTPVGIYVQVADPDAISEIFQRRTDFIRPIEMYKVLEVYGPCISTATWAEWPRHRKILATPFNEKIMSFVWDESVEQTRQLLEAWADDRIVSVAKDTRNLSLNVLAATGFRKSYRFHSANHTQSNDANELTDYRDALQTVLDNCILLMVAPRRLLNLSFAPESWKRLAKAADRFKQYMVNMLDEETKALKHGQNGSGSIMTSFVRAMDLNKAEPMSGENVTRRSASKGLTVDEIFGNIFAINFAGHDTTANTLCFATYLLAAHPEVQDWVSEELQSVEVTSGNYGDVFSQLIRCKAVLLETLRLFPPIPNLPKWTSNQAQLLKVGQKTITILPDVGVYPSLLAVQVDSEYWEDSFSWKPSRWIQKSANTSTLGSEQLVTPLPNTYFPWSDGPQNCPGVKFSQVEFVAVMGMLLKNHRIHAIAASGETEEQLRNKIWDAVRDVDMVLLLRMKESDRVQLRCERV
ncbi:cytochrome P450 [Penicillium malachiteum]|nr:cytochrome P450 [Penicillium malachiteum]